MKNILLSSLALCFLFVACNNTVEELNETLPTGVELYSGTFTSNSYPTNGSITILEDGSGTKHLVIENFSTDNGPDLKVYLSTNTSNDSIISLGDLKAFNGQFSYSLNNTVDLVSYNHVLIWCEDFTVLFGHGILN